MTRFLDKVIEVNTEEHWIRLQPGIVLDALNIYLEPMGLQFGPDPASSDRAAMGGIVSNNVAASWSGPSDLVYTVIAGLGGRAITRQTPCSRHAIS